MKRFMTLILTVSIVFCLFTAVVVAVNMETTDAPKRTDNGYTFNIALDGVSDASSARIITGIYDSDGVLIGKKESEAQSGTIEVECDGKADSYKLFLWDNLNGMRPLHKAFKRSFPANTGDIIAEDDTPDDDFTDNPFDDVPSLEDILKEQENNKEDGMWDIEDTDEIPESIPGED